MPEIEKTKVFSEGQQEVPPAPAAPSPFQVPVLPPPPLKEPRLEASRLTVWKPPTSPGLASPMVSQASSGGKRRTPQFASLIASPVSLGERGQTPELASPASSSGQRCTPQLALPIASSSSLTGRGRKRTKGALTSLDWQERTPQSASPIASPASLIGRGSKRTKGASPRQSTSPKSKARRSLPLRDLSKEHVIVRADSGSEGADSDNGVGDDDVAVSELGVDFISLRATARRLRDHHMSLEGAVSNMLRMQEEGGIGDALRTEEGVLDMDVEWTRGDLVRTPELESVIASPASSGGRESTPQCACPIASPTSLIRRGSKRTKGVSPRLSPSPKSKARRSLPLRDLSKERVIVRADSGSEGGDSDNGVGDEDIPVSELGVDFISLRATARRLRDHHVSLEGAVSNMIRMQEEGGIGDALRTEEGVLDMNVEWMRGDFSTGVRVEGVDEGKDDEMFVSRDMIEDLGDNGYGTQAMGHGIGSEGSGLGDAAVVGVGDDGDVKLSYDFSWSNDFTTFSGHEETYLRIPGPKLSSQDPAEIFLNVWDRPIMERIVDETNRYAWQTIAALSETVGGIPKSLDSWEDTTVEELYRLFVIFIYMSMCLRTSIQEYWTTGVLGMSSFRTLMSRNRFFLLTRFLHFVDNDTISPFVRSYQRKLAKIAPILDHCNNKFASLYTPTKYLSLDESLLLWKSRLSWTQCIRTKAARFGIKSFELCEAETGYLLRCLVYAGKDSTMHEGPIQGFENCTAKVVLELMDGFLDAGHVLVMDNWYNQLALTRYLKSRRTDVIGTLNRRSVHVPEAIKNINERQLQRGEQVARHCGDITLIAWNDVKLVTTISTFHKDNHVASSRAGEPMQKPLLVHDYNKYMGGVDTKDQKLSMFVFERKRGKKWYLKLFKRLVNTSLLNAYIIYGKNPMYKMLSHRQFRYKVAEGLLQRFPRNNMPTQPTSTCQVLYAIRLDNGKHTPVYTETNTGAKGQHKRRRCVRCVAVGKKTRVVTMCKRCAIPLCLGPCWSDYHSLPNLQDGCKSKV